MESVWAYASAAKLDEFSQREVTERFGSIEESESQVASHKTKIQGVAYGKANGQKVNEWQEDSISIAS